MKCKRIMTMSYILIVVSLGVSTLLVILRVIALWSHSRVSSSCQAVHQRARYLCILQAAVIALWSTFIVSQCMALWCSVMTIVHILREHLASRSVSLD
jgi:hypothetical protein